MALLLHGWLWRIDCWWHILNKSELIYLQTVKWFLVWVNSSIWSMDGTLTGTIALIPSGPRSNDTEKYFLLLKALGMQPHYHIQFSVLSRTLVGEESYSSAEMQLVYSTVQEICLLTITHRWSAMYTHRWSAMYTKYTPTNKKASNLSKGN